MKFQISSSTPVEFAADSLVIAVLQSDEFDPVVQQIDEKLGGALTRMREREDLTGKPGELNVLPDIPQLQAQRLLVVGIGEPEKLTLSGLRKAILTAVRRVAGKADQTLALCVPSGACSSFGSEETLQLLSDAITVACSSSAIYKEEPDRFPLKSVDFLNVKTSEANKKAIHRGEVIGQAVNLTRELVNRHPDDIYPDSFAQRAADEATALGLRGEIFDEDMLHDEKMGSMLAVAQGSERPPRMVVLKYQGAGKDAPTIGLVGKGVTFDSGGLSLKTSAGMITMKSDMAGAATVLGAVLAIAKLKLPVNVTGYMGLVENMTGGDAYKLGSVLTARNGKTIEVHNTDAEGRLVLADVLAYAVDENVDKLVDLATLTGACVVALGENVVGAFTNDQAWCDDLVKASRDSGEDIWQMPMYDFFSEQLKSEFADCKNIGSRWGGAITAAKFLEQFVDETPWVHLDIAGPSYAESAASHRDAGGTGVMVRALVRLAMMNS